WRSLSPPLRPRRPNHPGTARAQDRNSDSNYRRPVLYFVDSPPPPPRRRSMTETLQARPSASPPLCAEDLSYTPPGAQRPIVSLERIHFEAGSLVGLIGPNG